MPMTAKRAKLSLDPKQRSKSAPPHGFDTQAAAGQSRSAGEPNAGQGQAPAKGATGRPAAAPWQAHRPAPPPESATSATPAAPHHREVAAASTPAGPAAERGLSARAAAIGRHPLVRAAAVALAAGLSLYLLRRRLF
jgi:hypothetical protein